MTLAVVSSHPVQYHAPVYRALQAQFGVAVSAIYGSDFSVAGYRDREFGVEFAWDTDLLSGYESIFLSRATDGGARAVEEVTAAGIGQALRQLRPSAVLLPGYALPLYRAAFWQAQRLGLPVLFRGEVADHARARGRVKRAARDLALRLFYRRSAALLAIGQAAYSHYRRLGCPEQKLFFSPYCVDTTPFQPDEAGRAAWRSVARAELGLADDQRVILFCGKLSPRKGCDLALEAAGRLPDELRRQTALVFLGDGELRAALQTTAAATPALPVRFVGFQNQQQLSRYYHAADLLVLPSRQEETWGLVVNEALHHGLPAVVSDVVGCAPDLIRPGVTGEVAPAGQVDALTAALARVLAAPNDAARRDACRQQAAGYSVARAAEGLARGLAFALGQPASQPDLSGKERR
jgi:glycosyltransferase involved in cell wall biosynthesis